MTTIGDLYHEYGLYRRHNDQTVYQILGIPDDMGQWSDPLTPSQEAAHRAILAPWRDRYESQHGPLPAITDDPAVDQAEQVELDYACPHDLIIDHPESDQRECELCGEWF